MLQDRYGLMWIGTKGGLNRFDGYDFTVYQYDPRDPNSLSDNHVRDLHEDEDGALWIATHGGGVNRFDPHTESFTRYLHNPDDPNSLAGDTIFSIFQDSQGNLWFGGPPGMGDLNRFDPATETFTRYSGSPGAAHPFRGGGIWDIIEDEHGSLWLAADFVLARFDPRTHSFTYYTPDTEDRRLATLHTAGDGTLWVGGSVGLYRFDPQTEDFTLYEVDDHPLPVYDILPNEDGSLWISTQGHGLYLFDPTSGEFTHHYTHDPTLPSSLSDNRVQDLYRDRGGVVWIATDDGLNLYDPRQLQFAHYRHDPEDPHSLAGDRVWGMTGDTEGQLWIGAGGTLNRFDLATERVTHYPLETVSSNLDIALTGAVYSDPEGAIWVAVGGTLYRMDRASGRFTLYNVQALQSPGSPPIEMNSLHREGSSLWIGAQRGGLIRFDVESETFHIYPGPTPGQMGEQDPSALLTYEVSTIYGSRDGTLWIGYAGGELSRFDPAAGPGGAPFRHYVHDESDPYSISSGAITGMYEDRTGTLWITSQRGLTRFDVQEETFTLYTERDGLPSSYVTGIQEDGEGNLWLATMKGLSRFDPQAETFHNYDVDDGTGSTEFLGSSWQSADGRLFFGGKDGLTAFYPGQIRDNPYRSSVILTDLYLFHEPVRVGEGSMLEQPLWATDHLTLTPDQTSISFEFAALSYAAPQRNRYRYMLEGLEETWHEVSSDQRVATYTHLPAGEYVFRVQGTNNSGVWSTDEATLALTVLPPWWERGWFHVTLTAVILGLIAAGVRWRMSALRRRSRILEEEVAARTESLRQSEERFAAVMNSMESIMYVADMETHELLFVNHTLRRTFGDVEGGICWQTLQEGQTGPCDFCTNQYLLENGRPTGLYTWEFQNELTGRWYYAQDRAIRWTDGRWVRLEVATDITERKQLEAQGQRLAVMEERERIGRELHDDLGQVMGYVSVQAQAALERLGQEEPEQVRAILHQLVQAANEAHDDVRQYILGVRTRTMPAPQNLFAALEEYLHTLRERYGLEVRVSWPENLMESPLAPEVETQLLRIIQEALTNVRKHAGTGTARLLFIVHPDAVQVVVEDDGAGFDPDALPKDSAHFGLQIMRERAESVSGGLEVRSAPGEGTQIIVRLPRSLAPADDERFGRGWRVLLVDDHPLYLEGLRGLLASRGIQVVGEAHDGLEAQAQARALQPDLILMDVHMERCDGVEATRRIKEELNGVQIVMLTMAADDETLFEALKAGASGYLLKNLEGAQFFHLLRQVMAGETVISPALASRVLAEFTRQDETEEEEASVLTARQREVLELVAQGLSNKEVAAALHVTERTVKYHVSQILERLQLKSRHQLAEYVEE
jgi:DNA-binding NarL/FixJ family response regulator/signal transduction histidine kinase/ligand-binding sensor domain-containing protein